MEFINNLGPIGKLMYKSNVCAPRHIGYYFDEQMTETNLHSNTYLMVNTNDNIPEFVTCLMINVKISFEKLHNLICDSDISSLIFFKDMFIENINNNVVCKNVKTLVCYNIISLNTINRFFPNIEHVYIFRHQAKENENKHNFPSLKNLHIYSSGSRFEINAPNLEKLSIYSRYEEWSIDVEKFPMLHTLRVDEKINITNIKMKKKMKVIQFFPSTNGNNKQLTNTIDLIDLKMDDLILPPTKQCSFNLNSISSVLGVYVNNENFFKNKMIIDITKIQIYDNIYPLKMCSQRFSNSFYKYFPSPGDITNELIERFNIQKQRENLILIFNFDFMNAYETNMNWQKWYNICIETYHRIPIIIQNGQLMLNEGTNEVREKIWPNTVNKTRNECIIFVPEEELIYINCSPMRLQTLVEKINKYRQQKFIINKLWLVTNGFEIKTKDIEERIDNLIIIHNEIKMYITF